MLTEPQARKALEEAVALAVGNVHEGGGPFGAVVTNSFGLVIATGVNRVTRDLDPTAHAEVTAIRNACQELGTFNLEGHTLVASCEPCPLCLAAYLWARLDEVVYAADRHGAARAGFDDAVFYQHMGTDHGAWKNPPRRIEIPTQEDPFNAWLENQHRIDY